MILFLVHGPRLLKILVFLSFIGHFGILGMGGSNSFVVDSYPVDIVYSDVLMVFATVLVVGLIAVGIPTKFLTKRLLPEHSANIE